MDESSGYWVYMLYCENDTYYTGYTNNLKQRYQSHLNGTGKCKYTRSFKPVKLAQCWKINGDKTFAMQLERYIKSLSREEKDRIIAKPSTLSDDKRVKIITSRRRKDIEELALSS